MRPLIIAIAGGSASGKSTVVREIVDRLKSLDVSIICHDDYYKDQSHLSMEERVKTNYDHPSSLDNDLLVDDIEVIYDYVHSYPGNVPYILEKRADEFRKMIKKKIEKQEVIYIHKSAGMFVCKNL